MKPTQIQTVYSVVTDESGTTYDYRIETIWSNQSSAQAERDRLNDRDGGGWTIEPMPVLCGVDGWYTSDDEKGDIA